MLSFSLFTSMQNRKKAEMKRIQAEQKYRSIFENAVMGVYQSSLDGRFIEANPSMAKMLGYEKPEELICNVNDIENSLYAFPNDRKKWLQLLNEMAN